MQDQVALRTDRGVRLALWVDAGLELVIAVGLVVAAGPIAGWFGVATWWAVAVGIVFAVAAMAIGLLARAPGTQASTVRTLALANVAGGMVGWAALVIAWPNIEVEGRWLLGAASDSFILIALLELVALRRSQRG
jgi:hypothetical protein